MRTVELKIPPVVTVLLIGTLMWATARVATGFRFTLPAGRVIALGLAGTGIATALLGVVSFRRAKTTVNPLKPAAASSLVVVGIYQLTRNPMYLGMLLILLGWAVFLANFLVLIFPVAYVPVMNRLQILPEEKALTEKFGTEFASYKNQVRRWL